MSKRKRLSRDERLAIVRERGQGATHKALAGKYGVTERTIYYTLKTEKERRRDTSTRTKTISVTLTPDELAAFDARLGKHGIANRSDGVRRLIQSANGIFQPDAHIAEELPWTHLWLVYFEEWLSSDDWKGGGRHPGDEPEAGGNRALRRRMRRRTF